MPRAATTTTLRLVFSLPLSLFFSSLCNFSLRLSPPSLPWRSLSPSLAAVTIFLPDTRRIIRTGSLLAWRFVGEAFYFLRCTGLSLPPLPWSLVHGRVSYAGSRSAQQGKERKTARGTQKERRKDKTKDGALMPGGEDEERRETERERERAPGSYRVSDKIHSLSPYLAEVYFLARFFIGSSLYRILSLALSLSLFG